MEHIKDSITRIISSTKNWNSVIINNLSDHLIKVEKKGDVLFLVVDSPTVAQLLRGKLVELKEDFKVREVRISVGEKR